VRPVVRCAFDYMAVSSVELELHSLTHASAHVFLSIFHQS
jgi:hypothetical protein